MISVSLAKKRHFGSVASSARKCGFRSFDGWEKPLRFNELESRKMPKMKFINRRRKATKWHHPSTEEPVEEVSIDNFRVILKIISFIREFFSAATLNRMTQMTVALLLQLFKQYALKTHFIIRSSVGQRASSARELSKLGKYFSTFS